MKKLLILSLAISLPCAAQITNVNTGSYANAGNGDTARTAFTKINNNFDYVESQIADILPTNQPTDGYVPVANGTNTAWQPLPNAGDAATNVVSQINGVISASGNSLTMTFTTSGTNAIQSIAQALIQLLHYVATTNGLSFNLTNQGTFTMVSGSDSLAASESGDVWSFNYNNGTMNFYPDGSFNSFAAAGSFFQAGGDGVPALGNNDGRLEYGRGDTGALSLNGIELFDMWGDLFLQSSVYFNGTIYDVSDDGSGHLIFSAE